MILADFSPRTEKKSIRCLNWSVYSNWHNTELYQVHFWRQYIVREKSGTFVTRSTHLRVKPFVCLSQDNNNGKIRKRSHLSGRSLFLLIPTLPQRKITFSSFFLISSAICGQKLDGPSGLCINPNCSVSNNGDQQVKTDFEITSSFSDHTGTVPCRLKGKCVEAMLGCTVTIYFSLIPFHHFVLMYACLFNYLFFFSCVGFEIRQQNS